jgi:hypothetical protein
MISLFLVNILQLYWRRFILRSSRTNLMVLMYMASMLLILLVNDEGFGEEHGGNTNQSDNEEEY